MPVFILRLIPLSVKPYIEFDYKCNGEPVNYKVELVTLRSNIGKGVVWYFLCSSTGKRCRKLYLVNKYFLYREAFKCAMYEKQTYSHYARKQISMWRKVFEADKIYDQLYEKHFKKVYKGKPTKKYSKMLNKLKDTGEV